MLKIVITSSSLALKYRLVEILTPAFGLTKCPIPYDFMRHLIETMWPLIIKLLSASCRDLIIKSLRQDAILMPLERVLGNVKSLQMGISRKT